MKKRILSLTAAIGFAALALSGCASVQGNAAVGKLNVTQNLHLSGKTEPAVVKMFGQPDAIHRSRCKTVFDYKYHYSRPKVAGYIPIVDWFAGHGNVVKNKELTVTFTSPHNTSAYTCTGKKIVTSWSIAR